MGIFKAPRIETADRTGLTLGIGEIVFDTDLEQYYGGDGSTAGGIAIGSGGGSSFTIATATDANITAANGYGYDIPNGVLSASRDIDLSALTTECEFYNQEATYTLTFTGGTVYMMGGTETVTELMTFATTRIRKVNSKFIIIN